MLTNLNDHYNTAEIFPHLGLSDHNIILTSPKVRNEDLNTRKVLYFSVTAELAVKQQWDDI